MELFQIAYTPENFETVVNHNSNFVNNLDFRDKRLVDYFRVIDHPCGSDFPGYVSGNRIEQPP